MLTAIFRCAGQSRASLSACSITLKVNGPTSPVRSAASMKVSASRKPRVGERHRASVSNPTNLARGEVDQAAGRTARTRRYARRVRMSSSSFSRSDSSSSSSLSNQAKAVPARVLGGIERDVALAKYVLLALGAADLRQADRGGDLDLRAADEHRGAEAAENGAGDFLAGGIALAPSRTIANSSPPIRAQQRRVGRRLDHRIRRRGGADGRPRDARGGR